MLTYGAICYNHQVLSQTRLYSKPLFAEKLDFLQYNLKSGSSFNLQLSSKSTKKTLCVTNLSAFCKFINVMPKSILRELCCVHLY